MTKFKFPNFDVVALPLPALVAGVCLMLYVTSIVAFSTDTKTAVEISRWAAPTNMLGNDLWRLADRAYNVGNLQLAESTYRLALSNLEASSMEYATVESNIGTIALKQGETKKAIQVLESALFKQLHKADENNPATFRTLLSLSDAYLASRQLSNCETSLIRAHKIASSDPRKRHYERRLADRLLRLYMSCGRFEDAIPFANELIESDKEFCPNPISVSCNFEIAGCCYAGAKQYDKAIVEFNKALAGPFGKNESFASDVHNSLGKAYLMSGGLEAAENHFVKAIELRERDLAQRASDLNWLSRLYLALIHAEQGKLERANQDVEDAERDFNASIETEVFTNTLFGSYWLGSCKEELLDLDKLFAARVATRGSTIPGLLKRFEIRLAVKVSPEKCVDLTELNHKLLPTLFEPLANKVSERYL